MACAEAALVIEKEAEASQKGFEIVHCVIWPTACHQYIYIYRTTHF